MRYLPISMHPSYDSQTHRFFTRLDETTMTIPLPASRLGLILGLSSVLLLPHGAMAQSIDPGLWEMRSTMDMADQPGMAAQLQEMQEALKNLSPEERKMMEQQMGGQGVGIGPGGAVRICISAQDAQDGLIREGKQENDCTFTQVSHSGKVWKGRVRCTEPPSQGDFTTTWHSSSHYSTQMVMKSKEYGTVKMQSEARRLGADCGTLARSAAGKKR